MDNENTNDQPQNKISAEELPGGNRASSDSSAQNVDNTIMDIIGNGQLIKKVE